MLWADPGTNLGFPLSLCLRARHLEVICSTKALSVRARGLLWAGSHRAWVSAQPGRAGMPGGALGCPFHLRRESTPGCRQGRVVAGLAWQGRLWTLGRVTAVIPLWHGGPFWEELFPLELLYISPLPRLPSQGSETGGYKAERPVQRSPQHFAKCFPSPPVPIYLRQWPRKAESKELALKCCLKCLLCVHPLNHTYIHIYMKSLVLSIDVISVWEAN